MNHPAAAKTYREQQAGSLRAGDHLLLPDGERSAEIHSVEVENDDFGSPAIILATLTGGGTLRIAALSSVRIPVPPVRDSGSSEDAVTDAVTSTAVSASVDGAAPGAVDGTAQPSDAQASDAGAPLSVVADSAVGNSAVGNSAGGTGPPCRPRGRGLPPSSYLRCRPPPRW